MNKQKELEYKIHEANATILEKENMILHYNRYAYTLLYLEMFLDKNGMITEIFEKANINQTDLNYSKEKLNSYNRTFSDITNELTFKTYYQLFEEFIFQVFTALYSTYPIFLKKDTIKFDLDYENVFSTKDIQEVQNLIIENKVKRTIQSNNISNILKKIEKIFGIEIKANENDSQNIILASLNRNILTHNNGIVNRIYLQEIKFHKLKNNYKLNDSIFLDLNKQTDLLQETVDNLKNNIIDSILKNLTQIDNYATNLNKNGS